jgi:pyruvate/2-oxoglutarate/acetoin dehydrogenase E1 component
VQRVGSAFTPVPHAASLEALHHPSAASIADAVRKTLG